MDSFARAQRDWETPPDEEEAVICESCGQEMEEEGRYKLGKPYYRCNNHFCPSKFDWTAKEMAEKLVDALDTVSRLESKVKHLTRLIRFYDPEYK